jgi:hypothetical protein
MERDNRIELSPPPWQGGVLPLYESRRGRELRSDVSYNTPSVHHQEARGRPVNVPA